MRGKRAVASKKTGHSGPRDRRSDVVLSDAAQLAGPILDSTESFVAQVVVRSRFVQTGNRSAMRLANIILNLRPPCVGVGAGSGLGSGHAVATAAAGWRDAESRRDNLG